MKYLDKGKLLTLCAGSGVAVVWNIDPLEGSAIAISPCSRARIGGDVIVGGTGQGKLTVSSIST